MTRRTVGAAIIGLFAIAPVPSASASEAWVGAPTLISGTSRYDAGEFIYTDFVYDDYGANTWPSGQPNVVSLAPTDGDFRYPAGLGNAADIVEVRARLASNAEDLEVRVLLQTITDPAVPALAVEVNGVGHVRSAANATIDVDANTISFTLPGAAADGRSPKLNIGAGLSDGAGGLRAGVAGSSYANPNAFTTGGPSEARSFDLAFNTHALEGRGAAWNEAVQSAALQAGDLTRFAQTIDTALLAAGTTTPMPRIEGYQVRLFESRQELGEGMGSSFPQYRGRWQPYALWLPAAYEPGTPTPLFLSLHSLSVHHNQYRGGTAPQASYKTYYEQFEAELDAIVATPLARGPDGWYEDEGLVDALEVWSDVLTTFTIDPERVHIGGYSMGGYGTYRFGTMMPDAFASAVSIVGPPSNGIWAYPAPPTGGTNNPDNTYEQLEGFRHIPIWITHGVQDELVPVLGVAHQADRFRELGYEYRFALHPVGDHLAFVFQDEWSRESRWLAAHPRRVRDPHQVSFKVRPASWATDADPVILGQLDTLTDEVGARLDGAYWVDDVVPAGSGDVTGSVDLRSDAITRRASAVTPIATAGVDGPSPYALTGADVAWSDEATSDALAGSIHGVESLTIDVGRAQLSDAPDVSQIDTGGETVTITFVRNGAVVGNAVIATVIVTIP